MENASGLQAESVILGIDPGLNITGYGLIQAGQENPQLLEAGVVRGGRRTLLEQRLKKIHDGVSEVIRQHRPMAIAVEELYSHYRMPRTAIMMGHARGVICLAAAQHEIPVYHYAATQIKKVLTGNGRATKQQMQNAICHEFGLATPPEPADVADALAIALCHHYLGRNSQLGNAC
ncbi:MAG: crossover junction endodeoxyribonuclease RuvC [Planctomycetota bacterium]|nr:crossover junction endodeoxyribonuclease RuvC [Planctomycetota bacterium]MEE2990209.1 crossover junction endodeoxyribonuclease RuvC [Planctomycetota bacterium]